jgi:hypothetical protein
MVNLEQLKAAFAKVDLAKLKVRAAAQFDLANVPEKDIDKLVYMATHCALNGPVGVKKRTTWPGSEFGEVSILDILTVSNAQWKVFVKEVVGLMDLQSKEVKESYTYVKFGSPWPLCDAVFKAKPKQDN